MKIMTKTQHVVAITHDLVMTKKNKMQHVADAIHALVAEPCLISNLGSTCHDNDHHSDGGDQFKFNDIYLGMVH